MVRAKSDGNVGVVLCDCSGTINRRLDFKSLEKNLNSMNVVAAVTQCSRLCDAKECSESIQTLHKSGVSRIVVGGCDKSTLDSVLVEALKESGVNPGLTWTVNIYEQCGLVHKSKKAATEKANRRLAAAVSRVMKAEPVTSSRHKITRDIAVVGSGLSGKQAAVTLADLGHNVMYLPKGHGENGMLETIPELSGHLGEDPFDIAEQIRAFDENLNDQIKTHKRIHDYSDSVIKSVDGDIGNFSIILSGNGDSKELKTGALMITSSNGASADRVSNTGKIPGIVSMKELLELIHSGEIHGAVALLAGFNGGFGCSASTRVLSASEILANRFGAQVKVYCTDVQVAATGVEKLYRRARSAGVVFVKSEEKPVISKKGSKYSVTSIDHIAGIEISDEFDLVVETASETALNSDGVYDFLKDLSPGQVRDLVTDNVWLQPALTNRPGIYLIGEARSSSEYRKVMTGGLAAAHEIHSILSGTTIEKSEDAATIDSSKCVQCLTCIRLCPHGAIHIDIEENAACASSMSCQRCGICASVCPAKAIKMPGYTDEQLSAEVGENPKITVFACENSAIPAANAASAFGFDYEPDIELISVPCSGRVDAQVVLSALEAGANKVFVLGCHPESCKYLTGSSHASVRMNSLSSMLEEAGFDGSRVRFGGIASMETPRFIEYVTG